VGASAFATPASGLAQWLAALAVVPLMACTTVAVLRHRLWDVEAFIARSAVYAVLTLAVVAAYLALVAVVGSRLGRGGSIVLAVVLVAVGLEPARTALQRQVNRLLYGQRDDPYAVLSALGQRLEGAAAAEPGGEALPGVARTVAEALRLPYAGVVVDGELVSSHGQRPAAVETVALAHRGVRVGDLEVGVRRGEAHIGDDDRRVLTDLARHLAGAANSLLLTRDLVESRQAIVTAREEERRRLHRDLHDDLGPALAALVLQLETAGDLVGRDPAAAEALLRRLSGHAREAVDVTRRIVADLRPPTLDELGLLGALRELAERFSSPALTVTADLEDPGRLPAALDVVLLRVAAEALANTARHSGARTCSLTLTARDDEVTLEVIDDGRGVRSGEPAGVGLGSIADRVAEVGGRSSIAAGDAGGTRVSVTLPRPR
jgi:signal transduction histidine kinase